MSHSGTFYYVGLAVLSAALLCFTFGLLIYLQSRTAQKTSLAVEDAKFEFQKRLAYIKARLERDVSDWQRKATFAEKALIDFYVAERLLAEVRESPSHRSRSFSEYRAVRALLEKHRETIGDIQMRRHLAQALFGAEGGVAYQLLLDVFRDVRFSSNFLAEAAFSDDPVEPTLRAHHEGIIWATIPDDEDAIRPRFVEALRSAEDIFGSVLRPRA